MLRSHRALTQSAAAASRRPGVVVRQGARVGLQRRRGATTAAAAAPATDDGQRVPPIPGLGAPHPHHGAVATPSDHPRAPSVELSPPLTGAVARSSGRLPSQRYASLIEAGVLQPDESQRQVIGSLDELCERLRSHQAAMQGYVSRFTKWADVRVRAEDAERERRKNTTPTRLDLLKSRVAKFRGADVEEPTPEELSNEHYGIPEPPPVPTPLVPTPPGPRVGTTTCWPSWSGAARLIRDRAARRAGPPARPTAWRTRALGASE